MPFSVQCPMCGRMSNLNSCSGCNMWFCSDHLFRHRKCKEGK